MEFSEIFLVIKGIFSNIFLEKIRYKSEIKKKQFENENKIYKKTWNVLRGFKETTYCLFNGDSVDVNEEILKRYRLDKYNKFKEKHEKFQDCIEENRIFYKQDIYNDLCKVKEICTYIADMYKIYELEARYYRWTSIIPGLPS